MPGEHIEKTDIQPSVAFEEATENTPLDAVDYDDIDLQVSSLPAQLPAVEQPSPPQEPKLWLVVAILGIYVVTSVADQQLLKNVFSEDFNAPFFTLHINSFFRIFTFPLYVLIICSKWTITGQPFTFNEMGRRYSILKSHDPVLIYFIKTIGIMGSVIVLATALNVVALSYATPSEFATVATTQVAMVYFVAVLFLHHKLLILKLFAVIISLTGVAVIAFAKGFQSDAALGIGLTVISTALFSFNITYYKHMYPRLTFGQCCNFITTACLFIVLVFWPLPIWGNHTGTEIWDWGTIPWNWLLSSVMCSVVASVSVNYCLCLASPLLISFASLLRIPCSIVIDYWLRNIVFSNLEVIGSLLIVIGFVVIVVPDDKVSIKISRISDTRD